MFSPWGYMQGFTVPEIQGDCIQDEDLPLFVLSSWKEEVG